MINMKLPHKESVSLADCCVSERQEYPYGLALQLNSETLAKLGMNDLPDVGTVLTLHARVEVVSVSQYEQQDGQNREVGLQITDMELRKEGVATNPQSLYPNSNMT